ncbi:NAD(P)H-binding protein [Mycolicibacterium farcinogenes]|uniref:NAD(P)H-binding protein n=1 Tax=Mycolicibacterium farcinogenes TaxID=1802 RepID=A0ACD1FQV1_MYCFR|nr:NAD(P)H-binding protein [Mycolicibacterium farcinogenes]QZH69434.1 NAD(P)H-binding protein [Mycolicibacterium farcinogenes]
MRILVTGITGLGGHFAPHLVAAGHDVIGLSRAPERVGVDIPVIGGDATRPEDLDRALDGVEIAYFMIHSLEQGNTDGFAARDRLIAHNFATAARKAGVRRVIYFGVPPIAQAGHTSAHVRSRLEVEDILTAATPESVAVGAFTIVTARSRSFRVLLNLLAASPVVPLPPWRHHVTQPMDARDVFACLIAAATHPDIGGRRLRIGGPELMSWNTLLRRLAAHMNLRRLFVPTPFDVPPVASKALTTFNGGNPALLLPLLETINAGDITIADNGADTLGVTLHPIQQTLSEAVIEFNNGSWRATEGQPSEPVRTYIV